MAQAIGRLVWIHRHVQYVHVCCHCYQWCGRVRGVRWSPSLLFHCFFFLTSFFPKPFRLLVFSFSGFFLGSSLRSFLVALLFQLLFETSQVRIQSSDVFVHHFVGLYANCTLSSPYSRLFWKAHS